MKFFVDTADIADIKEMADTGLLDGVTTNPSLIAKSGRDFMEVTKEICDLVDGPVSAEVVALDHETMMKEAETLRKIADNVSSCSPGFRLKSGTLWRSGANGLVISTSLQKRPRSRVSPSPTTPTTSSLSPLMVCAPST